MHRSVYRTESEHSEDSSTKRVSFNKDISVKHIPRGAVVDKQGHLLGYLPDGDSRRVVYNVYKEPPQYDEKDLEKEAKRILQQVQEADCVVSGAPAIFDTRSLDRPKKKKNNQEKVNDWSKTLPSTKNKLDSKTKKKELVEKNNKLNAIKSKLLRSNSASGEKLDTIQETSKETLNNSYIKDIERNNLGYNDRPVKNSNEQIFQQRQYSSEYLDRMPSKFEQVPQRPSDRYGSPPRSHRHSEERVLDRPPLNPGTMRQLSYTRNETDPSHLMPGGVIEPIYSIGFTHNRNRPFSYTGGTSPQVNLHAPRRYEADDSPKQHYEDDRNIYHSTQKLMEKDSIIVRNKARTQRDSTAQAPFKESNSRPSDVDQMPVKHDMRRENSKLQSKKPTTVREPSPPIKQRDERLPNKYGSTPKEPAPGYTTKIMINVDQKSPDGAARTKTNQLNSTRLVRDASDTSQTIGLQSSRLVRKATVAEPAPPPRPLRAKEKRGETNVVPENHRSIMSRTNDINQSKLAQRTATVGRVPSQRDTDKRDKKRKVKIVFEYKKAPEHEGDPLSRFVEYKGSDSRPPSKDRITPPSRQATLERRKNDENAEDAIRRHRSEQRYAEEALLEYERRARSLSPDKVIPSSFDDPEREERIRRQRDKFLTAIFGPGKIPGVMSDENIPRDLSPERKSHEDERRRVLSDPDLSTLERRRKVDTSVDRGSQERSRSNAEEPQRRSIRLTERTLKDRYDRREGFGKNRSPDRMETSESDDANNRANIRRSRVDLAGSLTPPTPEYDTSSYSSNSKNGGYKERETYTRYGDVRTGNPVWIVTVKPSRENLEQRNSDFSESERDYRREMALKKIPDTQTDSHSGNWNSMTLNRLEVKNKKNRDVPASKTLERSETFRDTRPYASTDVADNVKFSAYDRQYDDRNNRRYDDRNDRRYDERNDRYPSAIERISERENNRGVLTEEKENSKNLRYFGDTDLESERNGIPYKPVLKSESTIKRTTSSVSTAKEPKMDYLKPPKLIPNSLSSSLNSSESETGEAGSQAASASSQRSVYLHATTVADIPTSGFAVQRRRDDSVEREVPQMVHPVAQAHGAQLKNARHVSRSFSVLTPWKPRHYREKYEINYSNRQGPTPPPPPATSGPLGKPPRPPRKREVDEDEAAAPSQMSTCRPIKAQPKETKVSGWFKRKKRAG